MAYNYNPLIPLNLQKQEPAATPGDIDRLQGEIDTLTSTVGNKVTKFFTSIEELEIDETGEFQGETNETFTYGYFYKRGSGVNEFQYVADSEVTIVKRYSTSNYYQTLLAGNCPTRDVETDQPPFFFMDTHTIPEVSLYFYVLPLAFGIISEYYVYDDVLFNRDSKIVNGYLLPFARSRVNGNEVIYQTRYVNNVLEVNYNDSWLIISSFDGYGYANAVEHIYSAYIYSQNKLCPCWFYNLPGSAISFYGLANQDMQYSIWNYAGVDIYTPNLLSLWTNISIQETLYLPTYVNHPSITRVDTQPSLNPADFATAAQGAKADTALQSISKGTDGNYVTTTVTAKSDNTQTVASSLTLQPLATADNDHKGVAESSDVKSYINNNTATATQGGKADTALQQIIHGTDGLYVTTTVTQKASNEQTIYTSLTLQDVETADDANKGVAEASNVRKMFNIISAQSDAYGIMWDTANPSPQCTRIGNMYNHQTLPVQSGLIGGVMADNGTFTPFDNQTDWTQATQARDGSDGQVMIKIPQHWRRLAQYGTIREMWISPVEMPGYVEIPTRYCGAYEASIERSTGKLCSVNNATADYRGGDNTSAWDGTYRTLLNRPVTNMNQSEFLAAARLRAAGTSWNHLLYKICRDLYWLYVTEYATLDSQADYNAALDANGFRQGGLGAGVTTWDGTSWDNFNLYNPFIPCGYLDEYGNKTAIKNFSLYNADSTLLKTFSVNSYHGIMLPFGHTWKHSADVLINVESGDGNSAVYLCDNPANYNSSSVANYNFVCNQMRVDSYVKEMYLGDNADIFAIVGGGNSTSYYCDQQWCGNLPSSGSSLRCWLFGGSALHGSQDGLACAYSFYGPGYRRRHIGSRLCFVP